MRWAVPGLFSWFARGRNDSLQAQVDGHGAVAFGVMDYVAHEGRQARAGATVGLHGVVRVGVGEGGIGSVAGVEGLFQIGDDGGFAGGRRGGGRGGLLTEDARTAIGLCVGEMRDPASEGTDVGRGFDVVGVVRHFVGGFEDVVLDVVVVLLY